MFASYFELKEPPFRECTDCDGVFQSRVFRDSHDAVVRSLAETPRIVILCGRPGVGKSTLLNSVGRTLSQSYRALSLKRASTISWHPGHPHDNRFTAKSRSEQDDWVARCLAMLRRRGGCRPVLLVIDDADSLSAETLSALHASVVDRVDDSPRHSILLAGKVEDAFSFATLPSDGRETSSVEYIRLNELEADEIEAYIEHCLSKTGYEGDALFTADAASAVGRYSHGVPRMVNRLCGASLVVAVDCGERTVTERSVEEAASDISLSLPEQDHVAGSLPEYDYTFDVASSSMEELEQGSIASRLGSWMVPRGAAQIDLWSKRLRDWNSTSTTWREKLEGIIDMPAIRQQGMRYAVLWADMVRAAGRRLVAKWHRLRTRDGNDDSHSRRGDPFRANADSRNDSPNWFGLQAGFVAILAVLALGVWVLVAVQKAAEPRTTSTVANNETLIERRNMLEIELQAVRSTHKILETTLAGLGAGREELGRRTREGEELTAELKAQLDTLNVDLAEAREERAALAIALEKMTEERAALAKQFQAVQRLLIDPTEPYPLKIGVRPGGQQAPEPQVDRTTPRLHEMQLPTESLFSAETKANPKVDAIVDTRGKHMLERGHSQSASESNPDTTHSIARLEAVNPRAARSAIIADRHPNGRQTDGLAAGSESERSGTHASIINPDKFSQSAKGGRLDATVIESGSGADVGEKTPFAVGSQSAAAGGDESPGTEGEIDRDPLRMTEWIDKRAGSSDLTAPATLTPVKYASASKRITHRVERGDSLWAIARRYDLTVDDLRRWNQLPTDAVLRPGVTLVVSGTDSIIGQGSGRWYWYVVRSGDTLSRIARRSGHSMKDLRRWNDIGEQTGLVIGQRLRLKSAIKDTSMRVALDASSEPNGGDAFGYTALIRSAASGDVRALRATLAAGADPDSRNESGETATMLAAWNGHEEIVALLLEANADPSALNSDGWSALMYASVKGHVAVVRRLLEAGAEVNTVDRDGRSPLLAAVWNGHPPVVEQLLAAGADVNHRDQSGLTPLAGARANGHAAIVELLKLHGAKPKDLAQG
jgi:LysM repeat protein/energy-coupling factor transporter ATP-binding protein EcfA2